MSLVYLNDQWLPTAKASVSILDRGFLFGESVYEVISCHLGIPFLWEDHIDRLNKGLDFIDIKPIFSKTEWLSLLQTLIQKNQLQEQNSTIYCQVSAGCDANRQHARSNHIKPTILLTATPYHMQTIEALMQGFKAIVETDSRWLHCHIKSNAMMANTTLRTIAAKQSAVDAILIRDEQIIEGASSNVFIVKHDKIYTPPKQISLHPGVTRSHVIDLLQSNGFSVDETDITKQDLVSADEVWLTGTTKEILPITQIDDTIIGQVGPVWHEIYKLYQQSKNNYCQALKQNNAHH
ncbi:aminotransferase class IV [Gammaproteobacteria bacterium]|nr:aminotransferase class IV [Gammaproteobacteria bacterium]